MKKALIVTTVSGFVPQFEMNNVRILQQMGYEVHYATNYNNIGYGDNNDRLIGSGIIQHQVDFARSPFRIGQLIHAYRQLRAIMDQEEYSLVHCHTPVGAVVARLVSKKHRRNGTKVIYTAHGFHFFKGASVVNWLFYYPVERILAKYTDVLITINQEDFERASLFCKNKKTKVEQVPGIGIDVQFYRGDDAAQRAEIRDEARKTFGVLDDEIMLLSVGELTPRKNHKVVIKHLKSAGNILNIESFLYAPHNYFENKSFENYHYFICGKGKSEKKLRRMIEKAGLIEKVTLLGYRKDVKRLLYAADVFVFPSKQEGLPVALMEAIAAGLPVITSDIRGNHELVCDSYNSIEKYDVSVVSRKMKEIYFWVEK